MFKLSFKVCYDCGKKEVDNPNYTFYSNNNEFGVELCVKCYTRRRRKDSYEKRSINKGELKCEICGRQSKNGYKIYSKYSQFGKELCHKHYQQMLKYGETFRTLYDNNEIIEHDDYAEIVLYNKEQIEIAKTKIDLEDIDTLSKYKWSLTSTGYAINPNKLGRLHRYLMGFEKGEGADNYITVDHINRDRLDNRKENLRVCTIQENSCNSSLRSNNSSGFTGVYWHTVNKKWIAELLFKGEKVYYESFDTKEEAIEGRKRAEEKYFGEFAPIRKDD